MADTPTPESEKPSAATLYVVFHQRQVSVAVAPGDEQVTDAEEIVTALVELGRATGSTQQATRTVWKSLPVDERPGPDAVYVVVAERSLHELKPKIINEPQMRFST